MKGKTMRKRGFGALLARFVLSAILVISFTPVWAFADVFNTGDMQVAQAQAAENNTNENTSENQKEEVANDGIEWTTVSTLLGDESTGDIGLAAAKNAAESGVKKYIKLGADIDVPSNIIQMIKTPGSSIHIVLDLNGHKITFGHDCYMHVKGGTLELVDNSNNGGGAVVGTDTTSDDFNATIYVVGNSESDVANYSNLIVGEGVTVEGYKCIGMTYDNTNKLAYGINVEVNGTLKSIAVAAYVDDDMKTTSGNTPVFTLGKTGVINSQAHGIYGSGYANWNLAGTVDAGEDALSFKSGNITITGGSYTSNGDAHDPAVGPAGGAKVSGAALSLISDPENSADGLKVNITGGDFVSKNGVAILECASVSNGTYDENGKYVPSSGTPTADATTTSLDSLAISGGTFTAETSGKDAVKIEAVKDSDQSDNKIVQLSGGTYSSEVAEQYVKEGFSESVVNDDGSYGVGTAVVSYDGNDYVSFEGAYSQYKADQAAAKAAGQTFTGVIALKASVEPTIAMGIGETFTVDKSIYTFTDTKITANPGEGLKAQIAKTGSGIVTYTCEQLVASVTVSNVTTNYTTFEAAFEALGGNDGTITLLGDVTEAPDVKIPAKKTLNVVLNGFTLNDEKILESVQTDGANPVKTYYIVKTSKTDSGITTLTYKSTQAKAKVGSTYYPSIKDAYAVVGSTQVIELLAKETSSYAGVELKNGETLKVKKGDYSVSKAYVAADGNDEDGNLLAVVASEPDADGVTTYSTAKAVVATSSGQIGYASLKDAFDSGKSSFKLLEDVTVSETITSYGNRSITLNLNGFTVSPTSEFTGDSLFCIPSSKTVTITDSSSPSTGKITTAGNDNALYAFRMREVNNSSTSGTAALIINGGSVYGKKYAVMSSNDAKEVANITVTGGTVEGGEIGIYYTQNGTVTLSGGTIKGKTAVYMKSGKLKIASESTVILEGTGAKVEYSDAASGNATATGDALVLDVCGAAAGSPTFTSGAILGGTFKSTNASAIGSYATTGNAALKGFVKGGTYSSDVNDLCYTDYACYYDEDANVYKIDNSAAIEATVLFASGKTTKYTSLASALNAARTSGGAATVTLQKSCVLPKGANFNQGNKVTLDLNNFNIDITTSSIYVEWGEFEITGTGTITEVAKAQGVIIVEGSITDKANHSVVTIGENVTLKGRYGINVQDNNNAAYGVVVNMNGKIVASPDKEGAYAEGIYVNGNVNKTSGNVPKINISNTASITFDADGKSSFKALGLYLSGYAETTIAANVSEKVAVIDASADGGCGIDIRSGVLTVKGGKISGGTASATVRTASDTSAVNGNIGIVVAQNSSSNALPLSVSISGGTINGNKALYESNAANVSADALETVSLAVSGGEYISTGTDGTAIYSQDCTQFVSAGTFTDQLALAYAASGKMPSAVNIPTTGKYTVVEGTALAFYDGVYYTSFEEAYTKFVAAGKAGAIKVVAENVAPTIALGIGDTIVCDESDYALDTKNITVPENPVDEQGNAVETYVLVSNTYKSTGYTVYSVEEKSKWDKEIEKKVAELEDELDAAKETIEAIPDTYATKTELTNAKDGLQNQIDALKTAIGNDETSASIMGRIKAIETKLAGINDTVKKYVDDEVAKLQTQITTNKDAIDALDSTYATDADVADKIAAAKKTIEDAQKLIDNAQDGKIADAVEDITVIQGKLTGIETTVTAAINAAVKALEDGKVATNATNIKNLQDAVKGIQDTYATKAELTEAQEELLESVDSALTTAKAYTDQEIQKLQTKIDTINATIETLATSEELAEEVATLNESIADAKDALEKADEAMESDISDALTRIGAVEDQLDGIEGTVKKYIDDKVADLQQQITDNKNAIDALDSTYATDEAVAADIAAAKKAIEEAQAAIDEVQTDNIATATANIKTIQGQLTGVEGTVADAIKAAVSALETGKVDVNAAAIKALQAAVKNLEATDATLTESIASVNTAIRNYVDQQIATLSAKVTENANAIDNLDSKYATDAELAEVNKALTDAKAALEKADANLDKDIDAAIDRIADVEDSLAGITGTVKNYVDKAVKDLQTQLDSTNDTIAKLDQTYATDGELDKAKSDITAAQKLITDALDADIVSAVNRIAAAESKLAGINTSVKSYVEDEVAKLQTNIDSLKNGAVAGNSAKITDLQTKLSALDSVVSENDAALKQEIADAKSDLNEAIANLQTQVDAQQALINILSAQVKMLNNAPVVSASATYNSINLKWTLGVAEGVVVNGVDYAKAAGTSALFANLSTGSKYTYTVIPYVTVAGEKILGQTITVSASPKLAQAKVSSLKAGKKKATVSWASVAGAGGYKVKYKVSGKKAKTVTVKSTSLKKTIKKLTTGKKVKVYVRAYTVVNGKTVYGSWSKAKSVKVK